MAFPTYEATVLTALCDEGFNAHSYLLDIGQGRKARLPVEELRYQRTGAPQRVVAKGDPLRVKVIHENKRNGRLVVSERAAHFTNILDRLKAKGWREEWPEEHQWFFSKGRWRCIATWPTWHISFRRR